MARLMAVADGNNTSAGTWAVIDSTSFNESESNNITVPTTYATTYTQFTPGAITIDGIAVRLANRTGTTGTFSIELYNHTLTASVAGTEVTINCSDFADALSARLDGGWYFFKFGSPVLLLAANNYSVRFKTSSTNQITLHGSGSTNPCRMLRTTTTQAPVAGDDRFIMGEWTAAATTTTRTVTGDDTTIVDYGSAATSQATPALSISAGGSFILGTSASTAYNFKISGHVVVYNGGTLKFAETSGRMPTTSSVLVHFDCVSNADFGLAVRRKATCYAAGASKTRWTTLTGDEAAAQTVIGVADTTGWVANDVLAFAGTGTSTSQNESKSVSTVDSGVQVTLSAGLTNAHTGSGDVVGEVGNLTSNVRIIGTSASVGTFICFHDESIVNWDNVEIRYFGSNTANRRGVECQHINTSANSCIINSCAFRDYSNVSAMVGNVQTAGAMYYITNCVSYNASALGTGILATGGFTGTPTFDVSDNLVIACSTGFNMALITGSGGTCNDNRIAGCTTGVTMSATFVANTVSNMSGFYVHTCGTGMSSTSQQRKTITSFNMVCNAIGIVSTGGVTDIISCNLYGNSTAGVSWQVGSNICGQAATFTSCNFRGRTGFAQPIGYTPGAAVYNAPFVVVFNSCSFGATTAHTTADVNFSTMQGGKHVFNNCTFASTTEFNSTIYTFLDENASVGIQRLDTTAGNHKTYVRYGIITRDTAIFNAASPSLRVAPQSATIDCSTTLMTFKVPVNSGQTCTPVVPVRESESGDGAAYNGSRVKLYVKANHNLGITSDTLLDTATAASDGAFESLTGTTAAATDDGVFEFYIVCNGTTGWINIDDITATVT